GGGEPQQSANPQRFDLIVSNPPYIESDEIPRLAREVRGHDPLLALDGGPDGLAPYRIIAGGAPRHLKPGGRLMVEIGSGQGRTVAELLEKAGFRNVAIDKDLAGLDRVVSGHHLHP
ncbi:N5-glutamine methyltransferase family protein, partial [Devosia geojensis]|uniref:N5-glutamine methyltransferase family protein n=1 Tax=Devosia geojensis TaxID=443610 RepID=UPI001364E0E2